MKVLRIILVFLLVMASLGVVANAKSFSVGEWVSDLDLPGFDFGPGSDSEFEESDSISNDEEVWRFVEKVDGCGNNVSESGADLLASGGKFKVIVRPCSSDQCLNLSLVCTMTNTQTGNVTKDHRIFYFSIDDDDPTHSYIYEFEVSRPDYIEYSDIHLSGMNDGYELYIYVLEYDGQESVVTDPEESDVVENESAAFVS